MEHWGGQHRLNSCEFSYMPTRLAQPFADLFDDRILIGKLAGLQLRVDEFAVGSKLEAPATGRLKLEALDTLFVAG